MNRSRFSLESAVCWLAISLLVACSTPARDSAPPPVLAARLNPTWIASAKRLQSGNRTIYYHGRANAAPGSLPREWSGTIEGEVLVIDTNMAIIVPAGTFTLHSTGAVATNGPHTVVTDHPNSWKHLLHP